MKVIDLLNKIANGEEAPEQIQFRCSRYKFDKIDRLYRNINGNNCMGHDFDLDYRLNEGVTVIEEDKKIKKIYYCGKVTENEDIRFCIKNINLMADKVNEIIDVINEMKNED